MAGELLKDCVDSAANTVLPSADTPVAAVERKTGTPGAGITGNTWAVASVEQTTARAAMTERIRNLLR